MTETSTYSAQARRLERSRSDRKIAGVAGGLGQYFDIAPIVFRVGFIILTLLGGSGLLVYVAGWLILPEEGKPDSVAGDILRNRRERPWAVFGLGLLALAGLIALGNADLWPSGNGVWVGLAILGAIILWNQRRTAGKRHLRLRVFVSLLAALVVAAIATAAVALASFGHLGDGTGDRVYSVSAATELHQTYRLGVGSLKVDLSRAQLPPGVTPIRLRVGIGDLRVIAPADAIVQYKAKANVGQVSVAGAARDGRKVVSSGSLAPAAGKNAPVLVLDADVGLGHVQIDRAGG